MCVNRGGGSGGSGGSGGTVDKANKILKGGGDISKENIPAAVQTRDKLAAMQRQIVNAGSQSPADQARRKKLEAAENKLSERIQKSMDKLTRDERMEVRIEINDRKARGGLNPWR